MYDSEADTAFYGAGGVRPTHTIYSYDYQLGDKREILSETHKRIRSIYVNDGLLMYCMENEETDVAQTYTTRVIDTDTMEVLFENNERFTQEGCLAPDGAGAYSFVTIGDFDGIGYFDFEMQSYTPFLEYTPADSVSNKKADIVNFQMLRMEK